MQTNKHQILESGTLINGKPYHVILLRPADAAAAAQLHARVITHLPDDEKSFIFGKDRAYFAQHLRKSFGNAVIGIVCDGKLAAQSLLRHPVPADPETGMTDMPPVAPPQGVSIMQAVSVDPAYRGCGLMNIMIRHWIAHAAAHGRTDLLAEIEVRNGASWANFLRAGLNLVGIGCDPSDGALLYNAHEKTARAQAKFLTPEFNRYAGLPQTACAPADIATQRHLLARGYAITGRDGSRTELLLTKLKP